MKDYNILDDLVTTTQNLHREIFDRGYNQGYEDGIADAKPSLDRLAKKARETYNNGMNDAWECVKQLEQIADCQLTTKTLCDIFGDDYYYGANQIIRKYSASEVIAKIKAWEENREQVNDEIKVGDEVNSPGFHAPVVVVALYDSTDSVKVMNAFGDTGIYRKIDVTKTGRYFDQVSEVLEQLKIV